MQHLTHVPGLPVPAIPLSLGVIAEGRFLFVAGLGPYSEAAQGFVRGSTGEQTTLTLECIRKVVFAAGAGVEDIVSCRVFLQQITELNFREMNAAYDAFFGQNKPARTTIGCQLLNIDVEIDCIVRMP